MLERIADGRTDPVFERVASGHAADAVDGSGVSLIRWCAHSGDVSAIRFPLAQGQVLESLGGDIGVGAAASHPPGTPYR
jgi:uncharacterized protein